MSKKPERNPTFDKVGEFTNPDSDTQQDRYHASLNSSEINQSISNVLNPGIRSQEIDGGKYRMENIHSADISPELVSEMSDLFRATFYNSKDHGWGQYAFCSDCHRSFSASEVYKNCGAGLFDSSYDVPLSLIDSNPILPICCGKETNYHEHPEKTLDAYKKKLSRDAWVTLMREPAQNNELVGMAFTYTRTLAESFKMEEWEDPYYYSSLDYETRSKHFRSFEHFQKQISDELKSRLSTGNYSFDKVKFDDTGLLSSETPVNILNCVILSRKLQGQRKFFQLAESFFNYTPPEIDKLLSFSEVIPGTPGSISASGTGGFQITNVFKSKESSVEIGESVLICYSFKSAKRAYDLMREYFKQTKK